MRPTTYKPKIKDKPCTCKDCDQGFLSADPKSAYCDSCRAKALICECGKAKDKRARYCGECRQSKYSHTRGKTYEEIMGEEKAQALRESKVFRFKASAKATEGFRSLYERDFASFLTQHQILYQYEVTLQGLEKSWSKIVDFHLPQEGLYIELSGYIWAARREDHQAKFLSRVLELASLIPSAQFVIATEPSLLPRISEYFEGFHSLGQPIKILSLHELREYILSVRSHT